jgi:SH3-like domain-containing protein
MKQLVRIALPLLFAAALAACGAPQPVAQSEPQAPATATRRPTRTPRPPTATPAATATPNATAAPDVTATTQPATPAAEAAGNDDLRAALVNMQKVKSARISMQLKASGDGLAEAFGGAAGNSVDLFALDGSFSGKNADLVISGQALQFMDPAAPDSLKMRVVDNKVYIHGPLGSFGAPQDRWYMLPSAQSMSFGTPPMPNLNGVVGGLALKRLDLSGFVVKGSEQDGGASCAAYAGDKEGVERAIDSLTVLGQESPLDAIQQSIKLERADLSLLVCDDGYIHRADIGITALDKSGNQQRFSVDIALALKDFDQEMSIVAPEGALQLEQASSGMWTGYVLNGGNIREEPSLRGKVLGQLHAGQTIDLLERSADGNWYHVIAPEASGWVSSSLLRVDPDVAAELSDLASEPDIAPGIADSGALSASVFNGGNVRSDPSLRGSVLDQINAGESVELLARNQSGTWYRIRNVRGVVGWVNASLLTIEPGTTARVPVA